MQVSMLIFGYVFYLPSVPLSFNAKVEAVMCAYNAPTGRPAAAIPIYWKTYSAGSGDSRGISFRL